MAPLRFLLLAAFSLFFLACSSDREDQDTEVLPDKPRPYELAIPATLLKNFIIPADNPLTVEGVELGRHLFL